MYDFALPGTAQTVASQCLLACDIPHLAATLTGVPSSKSFRAQFLDDIIPGPSPTTLIVHLVSCASCSLLFSLGRLFRYLVAVWHSPSVFSGSSVAGSLIVFDLLAQCVHLSTTNSMNVVSSSASLLSSYHKHPDGYRNQDGPNHKTNTVVSSQRGWSQTR